MLRDFGISVPGSDPARAWIECRRIHHMYSPYVVRNDSAAGTRLPKFSLGFSTGEADMSGERRSCDLLHERGAR